MGDRQLL